MSGIGIGGEIIPTRSHSPDSVSLVLKSGECFVGDLQPREYMDADEQNDAVNEDWTRVTNLRPKRIFYAHAN